MKLFLKYKKSSISVMIVITLLWYIFNIPNVKDVPKTEEDQIRVMSYNLRYGWSDHDEWIKRKDLIAAQILEYKPDSIGIQEGDSLWMSEDEGLPAMLEGYDFVGVGRDDGATTGEYAAIFYLKDKYEVVESGNFWLSETPEKPSIGWDAVTFRICSWVTLRDVEKGNIYTHYNTHLDHKGENARAKSASLIIEKVSKLTTPSVITGDFNFFEHSDEYDMIVKSGTLKDSKYIAEDSMNHGTMNWFLPINLQLLRPIDFCFITDESITVDTYRVDNSYRLDRKPISDHFPIIIDFRIN